MSRWLDRLRQKGQQPDTTPKSHEKTAVALPESKIQGVEITEIQRGIPLPNWESVKAALYLYGSGRVAESLDTRLHNIQAYAQSYGPDGLLFFDSIAPSGPVKPFIDGMLTEAQERIGERGKWSRHYDYDGVGVFHKTSVSVDKAPDGEPAEYVLGIHAAYVGDKPEKALAESLGVERTTLSKGVIVEYTPTADNTFGINLDDIAERVIKVFGNGRRDARLTGKALADYFMSRDRYGHPVEKAYPVGEMDGFKVSLRFGRVGDHIDYGTDRSKELWKRAGNTLHGGLKQDFDDRTKYEDPTLVFSIVDARKQDYDDVQVIDRVRKSRMQDVAQKVADEFATPQTKGLKLPTKLI